MGKYLITKGYYTCSMGLVPAKLDSKQDKSTTAEGFSYLREVDKTTQISADFVCRWAMVLAAAVAAFALLCMTNPAGWVILAAGAGALVAGGIMGGAMCGSMMAPGRKWVGPKKSAIFSGAKAVTTDSFMTCQIGGQIRPAPGLDSFWKVIWFSVRNTGFAFLEGIIVGATIYFGGSVLRGTTSIGSFLSTMKVNYIASLTTFEGIGVRLLFGLEMSFSESVFQEEDVSFWSVASNAIKGITMLEQPFYNAGGKIYRNNIDDPEKEILEDEDGNIYNSNALNWSDYYYMVLVPASLGVLSPGNQERLQENVFKPLKPLVTAYKKVKGLLLDRIRKPLILEKVFNTEQLQSIEATIDNAVKKIIKRGIVEKVLDLSKADIIMEKLSDLCTTGDLVEGPAKAYLKEKLTKGQEIFLSIELLTKDNKGNKIAGSLREIDVLKFNKDINKIESGVTIKMAKERIPSGVKCDKITLEIIKKTPNKGAKLRDFLNSTKGIGLKANVLSKIESAYIQFTELSTGKVRKMAPEEFSNYLKDYPNFDSFKIEGISPETLGTTKQELFEGTLEIIRIKLE